MMISTIKELIPENEHKRRSDSDWLGITQYPPHLPTGSGGEKDGVSSWEEKPMRHVMPPAFPRNVTPLRAFKTFDVIFLECANATVNYFFSIEKTSLSYHLQILHIFSTYWLVVH